MKNSKAIIAVLCALVLLFSLAACAQQKGKTEKITQVVTNENGEIVTDANGEALTAELEAQIVTDENGKAVTEIVTGADGKPLTTVKDNKYVNVTQVVTVAQGAKTSSTSGKSGSTTKASGSKTTSTTKKSSSTTTASTTKKSNKARKIKITVLLPTDAGVKDVLTISVNGKEVKKTEVELVNLAEYSFTTSDKYKGEVEITATLEKHGSATVKTDAAEIEFEISYDGIPVLVDDED